MKKPILYCLLLAMISILIWSCSDSKKQADAYGVYEALDNIIVSAEGNGKLIEFNINEGDMLEAGSIVGYIDTSMLTLQKRQILANIKALQTQLPNIPVQLNVLEQQLQSLKREQKRIENLVKGNAATTQQLDDINSNIDVVKSQINATRSSLDTQTASILSQIDPLKVQMQIIQDNIDKCIVTNPIQGTVLNKFIEQYEFASIGKPMYKIANLSSMILKVYISETQLPQVKIGAKCTARYDISKNKTQDVEGKIAWIADKAEFTPKTIQTKDERVNLVYAVKIVIPNENGTLKIGMPGEVKF